MKLKTSAQTAPKTVQSSGLYGLVSFVLVSRVLAWRALGFRNMRCRVEGLGWAQGLILEVVASGFRSLDREPLRCRRASRRKADTCRCGAFSTLPSHCKAGMSAECQNPRNGDQLSSSAFSLIWLPTPASHTSTHTLGSKYINSLCVCSAFQNVQGLLRCF